jgi:hypothetical protein
MVFGAWYPILSPSHYDLSVEGRRFTETRPLSPLQRPPGVQTMPTDLSAIDLGTLSAAQGVIVAAFRELQQVKRCQRAQKGA